MKNLDRSNNSIHIIEHYNIHPGEEAIVREQLHRISVKQQSAINLR